LLEEIGDRNLLTADESEVHEFVREFVQRVLDEEEVPLNESERRLLVEELAEEALGLGPLAPLLADPAVTDILVNGPDQVFIEHRGRVRPTDIRFRDADHVVSVIERVAARVGRRIDAASPMADLRLPDGSRVNATLPPVSPDGPTLSIRRFGRQRITRKSLVESQAMSAAMSDFLDSAIRYRRSVLISGGTGAGKTTLLGAMAESVPEDERIVTIEDTLELMLDQEHVVRLETRPPNVEGQGLITQRDLVRNSLRMRPDRIILGEVRGAEALDMLQAMNTGHEGSLSTIHANSTRDALARLETLVLMAGLELPSRAIREQIVAAIDLIVHVRRDEDGRRRVSSIAEIVGMEGETPLLQEIFVFRRQGLERGRILGDHVATGIVPRMVEGLRERGAEVPVAWFQAAGRAARG
ncbi:MAG: CpaF family protein, partial [Myxococcota bacterium]|nr:CpaF family protein [Myxococcota bacterium]